MSRNFSQISQRATSAATLATKAWAPVEVFARHDKRKIFVIQGERSPRPYIVKIVPKGKNKAPQKKKKCPLHGEEGKKTTK